MVISFIVFIILISIAALGILCLGLVASLIQFILNFLIANILSIVLVLFGLFILLVILCIFLPESKEVENKTEREEEKENDSSSSTAKAHTRENIVSEREKSTRTVIDVKSAVIREKTRSNKSHQKTKTYRVSANHSTKAKPLSNQPSRSNENKCPTKNSYSTQTSISKDRRVNTETNFPTERSPIYDSGFSVVRPELRRLTLSPSQTTIKSGEAIHFKLTGLDRFDNQIEISDRISWSATAGKIDSTGLFSINSKNEILLSVTAQVGAIKTTSIVNVESIYNRIVIPQLKSLKVVPNCIYLKPNEEKVFEALGYDQHKNPIDCGEIVWSATGGTIDQSGKLIVGNNAKGIYQVNATSKHTAKYGAAAKTTLLTLGVSTRILSWAIANEEFFYEFIAPLLDSESDDDSLSETDALVQEWTLEIGRRIIAKLLKKASNLSFKEAFSNLSDSVYYIVPPELRRIEFVNPPSNLKLGDHLQVNIIGIDQAGDRINIENQIIWTATSGTIDSQGIFVANGDTDDVEITAKAKGTNIKTKIKIKIKASFEEHQIDSAKTRSLNNSANLVKVTASKTRTKVLKDTTSFEQSENTFKATNNSTQQNNSDPTNKQKNKIRFTSKILTAKSQSDCSSNSLSNSSSSNSDCNLLSNNSLINNKCAIFTNQSNGLAIYSPRFLIQAGQIKKFQVITGFDSQKHPIEYHGESVIWETTIGKINSEGLLKTPITFKDRYIEVSAKVNNTTLYYSFHTTGTHEYIFFDDCGYLPNISQSLNQFLRKHELTYLFELLTDKLKIFEVDNSSEEELVEWINYYLLSDIEEASVDILLDEIDIF